MKKSFIVLTLKATDKKICISVESIAAFWELAEGGTCIEYRQKDIADVKETFTEIQDKIAKSFAALDDSALAKQQPFPDVAHNDLIHSRKTPSLEVNHQEFINSLYDLVSNDAEFV